MALVFCPLAPNRDLSPIAVRLHIAPAKSAQFADPHTGCIEQEQNCAIPRSGLQAQHAMDVGFGQDAFGQPAPDGGEAEGAADVERQVSELVTEAEEGFHTGEGAVATGGGQIGGYSDYNQSPGDG
jgi:hypothetical protein